MTVPPAAADGADGPSDPGLAGERTSLAWTRMGLALLGIPSIVVAFAQEQYLLASCAAGLALIFGLLLLVTSLRRQRAGPGFVERGGPHLAAQQVLLTVACVLLLCAAGMVLVVARWEGFN